MIIVASACEGELISAHFGHCKNFNLYSLENNKIVNKQIIPNPGHKPGFLPVFLSDLKVDVLITGGIGGGAIAIFNEKKIKVYSGAAGNSDDAVKSFLKGTLESSGSVCHEHSHKDEC